MAHRLVWSSRFNDRVSIYERVTVYQKGESKVKGIWRSDSIGNNIVLRGSNGQLRTYEVREWLSKTECRATLTEVVETQKKVKDEKSAMR